MWGISHELLRVNDRDDIARWWEVVDRTTGQPLPSAAWRYDREAGAVVIPRRKPTMNTRSASWLT